MTGRNDEVIHPHERAGRAEKVAALVHTIDRYNERVADHAHRIDVEFLAGTIENDALWRVLSAIAGVRLPSNRTRQLVEAEFRIRASVAAKNAAGEDPFAGLFG